jgi:hypothetical protein
MTIHNIGKPFRWKNPQQSMFPRAGKSREGSRLRSTEERVEAPAARLISDPS